MSNFEHFSFSIPEFGTELTQHSHQTLYWLNKHGYLDNETTDYLLSRMVVVPVKNTPGLGERLLNRLFSKDADNNVYTFPITLVDGVDVENDTKGDKPTLSLVKK